MGQYRVGDTIVFDRREQADLKALAGRECLVTLADGREIFCKYIFSDETQLATIIPLSANIDILEQVEIDKIALAVMLLRKLGN